MSETDWERVQEVEELVITEACISAFPKKFLDPLPIVSVTTTDGIRRILFSYYPDEIQFTEREFIGLTIGQARRLKFEKDKKWLMSHRQDPIR
jgi:hypothetical protein